MILLHIPTAFEEFIAYLAEKATPEEILAFEASEKAQARAEELLDHNSAGTLTLDERLELEQMLHFDRIVSALKAKALEDLSKARVSEFLKSYVSRRMRFQNTATPTRYLHTARGIHAHKDASGNWEYMLQDGLGSVRAVVNSSAVALDTRLLDPYGNTISTTPTPYTSQTPYSFTGEPRDANGLQYHRARYYHPTLAIFPSLDPFEGVEERPMSMNGYSWVEGNPANDAVGEPNI